MDEPPVPVGEGKKVGFFKKFFKQGKELPAPTSYVNMNRCCRSIFVGERQKFEGVNLSIVRPLSNLMKRYPSIFFVHNFSVGQTPPQPPGGMMPGMPMMPQQLQGATDGYQFQCQYVAKNGRLVGVWSPNQYVTKGSKKWEFGARSLLAEVIYERLKTRITLHNIQARVNFKDNGYCMETRYKTATGGDYTVSFTQAVTPNFTLGTNVVYYPKEKNTDLALAARFVTFRKDEFGLRKSRRPNMELFSQLVFKDKGHKFMHVFKTSLFKQIEQNTRMATELEWNLTQRIAKLRYGFEQSYLSGARVRVNVNQDLEFLTLLDFQLSPKTMAQVMTQAKILENSFKFGINLQFT